MWNFEEFQVGNLGGSCRDSIVVEAMNFDMITKGLSRKEKFNKRALGSPEFQVLVV